MFKPKLPIQAIQRFTNVQHVCNFIGPGCRTGAEALMIHEGTDKRHWKILLLEDDEDDILLIREWAKDFQRHSAEISCAESSQQALSFMISSPYDVIICDYFFEMNTAIEFIRNIHIPPSCPVIYISDWPLDYIENYASEYEIQKYIEKKDMNPRLLEGMIEAAIFQN